MGSRIFLALLLASLTLAGCISSTVTARGANVNYPAATENTRWSFLWGAIGSRGEVETQCKSIDRVESTTHNWIFGGLVAWTNVKIWCLEESD